MARVGSNLSLRRDRRFANVRCDLSLSGRNVLGLRHVNRLGRCRLDRQVGGRGKPSVRRTGDRCVGRIEAEAGRSGES
jgi:hypothetical protein